MKICQKGPKNETATVIQLSVVYSAYIYKYIKVSKTTGGEQIMARF